MLANPQATLGANLWGELAEAYGAALRNKALFSLGERGDELADNALLEAVRKHGRNIYQDEESQRLLDYFHVNAPSSNATDITLHSDP